MKTIALLTTTALILGAAAQDAAPQTFGELKPSEWSQRMAKSEMSRKGTTLFKDGAPKARWEYTSGLFAHSLIELGRETGDKEMTRYATDLVGSYVGQDGAIATYRIEDYNIDMITPGRVVLAAYEATKEERYKAAAAILRGQLARQPRTSDGGFWHKQRYPWQMWLDGLYMGSPFLAQYGKVFQEPAAFDEVVQQIVLMDRHSYDRKSGLHFHGWDEKREQPWADPQTGLSKCFWGRSLGWYAMAMVDCLDFLPPAHPGTETVNEILHRLAKGVVRYQDPKTGLWWQVVDQGGREGNYLETSASSMFVYALAKGINRGYLDRKTFLPAVIKGYEGLVRDCIRTDESGNIHLTRNCEVAGLGLTSAAGRPRDGTFEYYISEPVIENDLKGVGPFILAGIEVGKLASGKQAAAPVRGWQDVDAILARIRPPEFPSEDFPITDHGAKPGVDATAALCDDVFSSLAIGWKGRSFPCEQVFPNLRSPIPVECHLIHAFLRGSRIDRWPRKPDPPDSRAAAQAGLLRQDGVPFRKPLRSSIPAPISRFVGVIPVSTSCIPAPSDFPKIHRAGPPETMTMRQNVKRNTTFPSIGRQPAPPFTWR